MTKAAPVILSLSGGKDSTALLLLCHERKVPVDYIVYVDTTKDFPQISANVDKLEQYIGRSFVRLRFDFDEYFFSRQLPDGTYRRGYGWPNTRSRWCTGQKVALTNQFESKLGVACQHLIGLAYDEQPRVSKFRGDNARFLLHEWGITEADALQLCYDRGFDFGGIYKHMPRTSCWCCPFTTIEGLRTLYNQFPSLWKQLRIMDNSTTKPFGSKNLARLEQRFRTERFRDSWLADYKLLGGV